MSNGHRWFIISFLPILVNLGTVLGQEKPPPNIVLIIADDLGSEDIGPYGNKGIRTPHLDALAREGMRFDRAFLTCSSCSPSRASLITGRYPHNTGAEQLHWPVPADQITFVERLRDAGYWTAAAGKWHLGNPLRKRFDQVRDTMGGVSGCEQWVPTLRQRPKDRPFFLWLAAFDPHRDYAPKTIAQPHRPEDVMVPPYLPDDAEVRKDFAAYYDEITRLDGFVGQVMDELTRQGIAENTLLVFMSDNGRPFPRCKTTVYDSGIRTPMIARWPGRIQPGSVCSQVVSSIDLAPTFMELGKAKAGESFQGRSIVPLFAGAKVLLREYAYAEHNWHDYEARSRAVRSARWKYIANEYRELPNTPPADAVRSPTFQVMKRLRDAGKLSEAQQSVFVKPLPSEELYDCDRDPHELRNLVAAQEHQEVLLRMREALASWKKDTDDLAPKQRTPDAFDRETGIRFNPMKGPRTPPKQ